MSLVASLGLKSERELEDFLLCRESSKRFMPGFVKDRENGGEMEVMMEIPNGLGV